ncbi:MAG TPA: hypothetical protein VHE78_14165 [Gemmatimonadaceae bacterium]|nr:hypothetical protein [Gemmatimonadaceae bacterium]
MHAGISAVDVPTLWVVCSALALVAVLASVVPARPAMRLDPLEALKYQSKVGSLVSRQR